MIQNPQFSEIIPLFGSGFSSSSESAVNLVKNQEIPGSRPDSVRVQRKSAQFPRCCDLDGRLCSPNPLITLKLCCVPFQPKVIFVFNVVVRGTLAA